MSMTKRWIEDQQQKFVEYRFTRDGCPPEEAAKEDWESMVEAFYDGDFEAAWRDFEDHELE